MSSRATRSDGAFPLEPRRAGLPLPGGARARRAGRVGRAGARARLRRGQRRGRLPPQPPCLSAAPTGQRPDADDALHRARRPALRRARAGGSGDACAVHRFREACDRAGLRFRAWVVGLHNDSLAAAHPEAAARLLDGSPAGHSLCPSTAEAVEYVAALAADVAAQLRPEAVDLEAAFYPAWEPSYTLTLALEPLTDEEKLLWAQCSCPACLAHALPRGGRAPAASTSSPPRCTRQGQSSARLRLRPAGRRRRCRASSPESSPSADALLYGCGPLRGDELRARFAGLRELTGRPGTVSTNWTPERTDLAADVERPRDGRSRGARPLQPLARPGGRPRGVPCCGRRIPGRGAGVTILDGHVTIGDSRDASLSVEQLVATMDGLGIDRALVAPGGALRPGAKPRGQRADGRGRPSLRGQVARLRGRDAVARRARRSRSSAARARQEHARSSSTRRCRASISSTARPSPSLRSRSTRAGRSTFAPARRRTRCRCRSPGSRRASPRARSCSARAERRTSRTTGRRRSRPRRTSTPTASTSSGRQRSPQPTRRDWAGVCSSPRTRRSATPRSSSPA